MSAYPQQPAQPTQEELEAARMMFRAIAQQKPETDEELVYWIKTILGVPLPTVSVSDSQYASCPAQFVCDVFFERHANYLVLGGRDTMKTLCVSIIDFLNCLFKPGCETVSAGGIEEQAKKSHAYIEEFCTRRWEDVSPIFEGCDEHDPNAGFVFGPVPGPVIQDIQTETIRFTNRSSVRVVPATLKKVSGPHPNKAVADEVDLWIWPILMKWWGMVSSSKVKYRAQRILTSTRDTMTGVMNKLLESAEERNLKVYFWNVFDAMESCTENFGGCLCLKGGTLDKSACPLWDAGCHGRAVDSDGVKSYYEVVDIFAGVDPDTWEAQYVCGAPERRGLVYPTFDVLAHVTEEAEYDPEKGDILISADPGWTDPYAVILAQKTPYSIDVFDEIYLNHMSFEMIKRMLITGDFRYSVGGGKFVNEKRSWLQYKRGTYASWYVSNVRFMVFDYHAPADIRYFQEIQTVEHQGGMIVLPAFQAVAADAVQIVDRLAAVRRRLKISPQGVPGLRVHPRCKNTIWEFSSGYQYVVDRNSGEIQKETPRDAHNHAMDALGNLIVKADRPANRLIQV